MNGNVNATVPSTLVLAARPRAGGLPPSTSHGSAAWGRGDALRMPQKPAEQAISRCVKAAYATWPAMIEASALTAQQKHRLMAHFLSHELVASLARRAERAALRAGAAKAA